MLQPPAMLNEVLTNQQQDAGHEQSRKSFEEQVQATVFRVTSPLWREQPRQAEHLTGPAAERIVV